MKILPTLLAGALVVLGPSKAYSEPVVVVDSWWSGDYAKHGCEQAKSFMKENRDRINRYGCEAVTTCSLLMPQYSACSSDPAAQARSFEDELMSQFAINRDCKGTTFARYYGASVKASEALQAALNDKNHQTLIIDFVAGMSTQAWTMGDTKGEGVPAKIAADGCSIGP